jgi:predicted TIM-barrel fold metal-dependent hydrolase
MKTDMNRREFVAGLAALPFAAKAALAAPFPIIDAHIHLFDRTRPEGSLWPPKDDTVLGVSALPPRYKELVQPFGIVGAIVVEATPRLVDNEWVLDQAATNPIIVGHVGFLDPGKPDFGRNLERFQKNKLYLGIRYSNRENREGGNISEAVENAEFISNLKLLANAGRTLDLGLTVDPSVLIKVTDKVPSLRLIVPHLPNARMPQERPAFDAFVARLKELGSRPTLYMKLSEVIKRVDGKVSTDMNLYRDRLDMLWDIFGENRVIFGSDWPNSEHVGSYSDVMTVARAYVSSKGSAAVEKVFWRNSVRAYRWVKRDSTQSQA